MFLGIIFTSGFVRVSVGALRFRMVADTWSLGFFALLLVVSARVFRWSYYYIDSEEYYGRFILIVMTFVFSMVILIFIGRLAGALIG